MSEQAVLYTVEGAVATITLNRPQFYNALTQALHRELFEAMRKAERDDAVRCVVLTGAGKAFCSGQDLNEIPTDGSFSLGDALRRSYNPLVQKMRGLGKPLIAAVNGVAAGAGMSLTLACDLRICVDHARFVTAFVKIGLIPDAGMTYFLPRLIGYPRALELCMSGGEIDAQTALQWGLANRVVSAEEFPTTVRAIAEQFAAGPRSALSLVRRAIDRSTNASLDEMLEFEAMAQEAMGRSPDLAEGIAAFKEKRRANF